MLWSILACATEPEAPPVTAPRARGPEPTGEIVFVAEVGGAVETWRVSASGGAPRTLLGGGAYPAAADPLGELVLVVAVDGQAAGHQEELSLVPRAGGAPRALPLRAEFVRNPAWTPDGAAVIVESSARSFRDLYRLPRDGGPPERLTDAPGGSFDPAVAPDGTLLYASSRDGDLELYRQPLAGGAAERLTEATGDDRKPSFRPDGLRYGWLASRDGHTRVWTAASGSAGAQPLRDGASGDDLDFAWSPDGTRIAVVEQVAPDRIDLVLVDAVRRREIARLEGGMNDMPSWSPDGAWLVFSSTRSGDRELWLVRADGSDVRRLTDRPDADWLPRWLVR